MTHFKPLKNSIWDAAKAGDKAVFDKNCEYCNEREYGDSKQGTERK